MDAVAVLVAAVMFAVAFLLIGAGIALLIERRPDDPDYQALHVLCPRDPIERALTASHRQLRRRSLHPWAPMPAQAPIAGYPATPRVTKRDETLGDPTMLSKVIAYAPRASKAIVAGVTGGSAAYAGAVDGGVTGPEWIVIIGAALAAGVAVWLAPNKAPAT